MFSFIKTGWAKVTAGLSALMVSGLAFAESGTYDAITDAVDWADVVTAVVAIAALVAAVLVVMRGSRLVLSLIRR